MTGTLGKLTAFELFHQSCHGLFYFDCSPDGASTFDSLASTSPQVAGTTGLWHQAQFCFYLKYILKLEILWERKRFIYNIWPRIRNIQLL